MELLEPVRSFFWNEWFWLPANVTWGHLENKPGSGIYYSQFSDLLFVFPCALLLYVIRQLYEKYIVTPFGLLCGIKDDKPRAAPENKVLEESYRKKKNPNDIEIGVLAKQTDQEIRQIERWFRIRRNQDRPTIMKKFTETGWRFSFYLGIFLYGLTVLWDKKWLWDSRYCWIGYPQHNIEPSIFWYYMIELGFYWSLMFSQFLDVKRKDFIEMFVHHVATISLLSFSWTDNFVRVGTLVLCMHDSVDFWIEAAKMAKYAKAHKICDVLFAIFGLIWFITRLVCYPLKILYTTAYESAEILGFWPSLFFFNGWLSLLLILHVYWFSLIVRVAYAALTKVGEVDDVRSESEEPVSEEGDEPKEVEMNNIAMNNVNHVGNAHHVGNSIVANHSHEKSG